ncbi:hypothetical protein B9T33_04235 [Acinetobacter sp. ANC 5054]|uniref:TPR end-of-group domain-containing protein n=1 Tax=Acinetobacter sp. ANC 5054 TaxID=1977877 RepID=UPI000A350D69|nr:SIR2 family protein [Acinetobacter sp. ANC 5054]OTG82664.1 hypothetical protein B9T33_04235 [Acinetobacter sp. ANC 5054]
MSFTVQEVAQLLKQSKENKKPYVFFTGAGCSVKADVPSATGLIQEIHEKFPLQVKNINHEKDKYNYGKYMSALDKDERRRLLKPHIIYNKKINWAHIALACLMQAGYIQRVLTFNFDSILSRACNMLGLHPSIYDFATANPHLYHLINDPSIVHLHGQGTGFVQLNTEDETEKHTEKLGEFVAATLNTNPSLFIGYSGNADAFFPLLEEKYSEQHRLIWTGTKSTIDGLESDSVKKFLKKNNNLTHYIGDTFADDFLIQLAKELDCFPPELFSNPYKFLNQQLETVQPYPLGDGLDILENLTTYLIEQSEKSLTTTLYTAFIHKYSNKESINGLNEHEIDQVMWAYDQQARIYLEEKKHIECQNLYIQALSMCESHVGCINNYGVSLCHIARINNDIDMFVLSVKQFEKSLSINSKYVNSLIGYAHSIIEIAVIKNDEALSQKCFDTYDQVLNLMSNNPDHYANYGACVLLFAIQKQDEGLFHKAVNLIEQAYKLQPENFEHLNNYNGAILSLAYLKNDKNLFDIAFTSINNALEINPERTYNLVCYYSITSQNDLAKDNLFKALSYNTLPNLDHLNTDKELDNIRNEPWFIELLERLKEKEDNKVA